MKLSKFWDIENQSGKLIVHDNKKVYAEYLSPEKDIHGFNRWVEISSVYLYRGPSNED
ncbi:hypothetical protein [Shouchella miscanthi]|uniref:hypothetical protein n=1 Tax=Shouchella miscanthi TaxID=2598861 RepID=UPI001643B1F5|nr:hypothetical protein [Shouchella miscanthi]